jgi:hypothetical protein
MVYVCHKSVKFQRNGQTAATEYLEKDVGSVSIPTQGFDEE